MKKTYSKPLGKVLDLKKYFIDSNDSLVQAEKKSIELYKKQPRRTRCKICGQKFGEAYLQRKDILYFLCSNCGHFNGEFEDTKEFGEFIYVEENKSDERREYQKIDLETYLSKVENIYYPKTKFFVDNIVDKDFSKKKFLDVGSGIGQLVYSYLNLHQFPNVQGIDISASQMEAGNQILGAPLLKTVEPEGVLSYLAQTDANYVSMILVLEHVTSPMEMMAALGANPHVEYVLIAVPLLSLSVMTQLAFENVFERLLYGGHTHLYTINSLKYLIEKNGFEIASEWWFGSDVFDLFRSMLITMERKSVNEKLLRDFEEKYFSLIDQLQEVIDKAELCSEVHMVLKKV